MLLQLACCFWRSREVFSGRSETARWQVHLVPLGRFVNYHNVKDWPRLFSSPPFLLFLHLSLTPPTQLVTATQWVRRARHATRLQDSVPARTASPALPATAVPKATSRAARQWLHASVSSSHSLSVWSVLPVARCQFWKYIKKMLSFSFCFFYFLGLKWNFPF